jgi:hypothetical protein
MNTPSSRVQFASSLAENIREKLLQENLGLQVYTPEAGPSKSAVPVEPLVRANTEPPQPPLQNVVTTSTSLHSSSCSTDVLHSGKSAESGVFSLEDYTGSEDESEANDSVNEGASRKVGRRCSSMFYRLLSEHPTTDSIFTEASRAYACAITEPMAIPPPPGVDVYAAGSDVAQPFPESPSEERSAVPSSVLACYPYPVACWPCTRAPPIETTALPPVPLSRRPTLSEEENTVSSLDRALPETCPQTLQFDLVRLESHNINPIESFPSIGTPTLMPVDISPTPSREGSPHHQPLAKPTPIPPLTSPTTAQDPVVWGYVGQTPIQGPVLPADFLSTLSAHWAPPPNSAPQLCVTRSPLSTPIKTTTFRTPVASSPCAEDDMIFDKLPRVKYSASTMENTTSLLSQMFAVGEC